MASIRQSSFVSGELDPQLWGRQDLEQYGSGVRKATNFFVSRTGALVSRPGTQFIAECKGTSYVRLIPFVFSDDVSYVLEFGTNYIRFFKSGEAILNSDGNPYEVTTTYSATDLNKLKYAQVGNVLTLTHPDYTPQELRRTDDDDWTLSDITFDLYPIVNNGTNTVYFVRVLNSSDTDHPNKEWAYKITVVGALANGSLIESETYDITQLHEDPAETMPSQFAVYPDKPVALGLRPGIPVPFVPYEDVFGYVPKAFRIYRGRDKVFGLIGEVEFPSVDETLVPFTDYGQEPDYTRPPPQGRNPFEVLDYTGEVVRTENPVACGFFEQRQVFAGTTQRPGRVWLSATNDYRNFDKKPVETADGAVEFELASRKFEEARGLVGLDKLLLFTASSVWSAGGVRGAPISPVDLLSARVQTEVGSEWADPLVLGDGTVLFARSKGVGVRSLAFSNERHGYGGGDLSILAGHLFESAAIKDWCYAEDPYGIVWIVLSSGDLLSLTISGNSVGWARHTYATPGVRSICTVPEDDEDAVYMVVHRTTKLCIERMSTRKGVTVQSAVCLDSSVTGSGKSVSGLDHLEGHSVYGVADGSVVGPVAVESGVATFDLAEDATTLHAGFKFTATAETLDVAQQGFKHMDVKRVIIDVEASNGLWVGEASDAMTEWNNRTVADSYGATPLTTGKAVVRVSSKWTTTGRVVIQQRDPLPLTILGIVREGELGG